MTGIGRDSDSDSDFGGPLAGFQLVTSADQDWADFRMVTFEDRYWVGFQLVIFRYRAGFRLVTSDDRYWAGRGRRRRRTTTKRGKTLTKRNQA